MSDPRPQVHPHPRTHPRLTPPGSDPRAQAKAGWERGFRLFQPGKLGARERLPVKPPNEVEQRRAVIEELRAQGRDPFDAEKFVPTHSLSALGRKMPAEPDEPTLEKLSQETFRVAGRVVSKRGQGKAGFLNLEDQDGRMQAYVRKDSVSAEDFDSFQKTYVGDWVGVEGSLFRTKKGETTVRATCYRILTKAIRPLPEKWHGLRDQETRYRQRYLDLASSLEVRETFKKRSLALRVIRNFLDDRGFLEVENPTLHVLPGGAEARPFVTHHNALGRDFYLRIAHELHLKRLLVGGFERVYEIGKVFRNEGVSTKHNPEFTLLEAYWAYASYEDWMEAVEDLFRMLAETTRNSSIFTYKEKTLDFSKPWRRLSYDEALKTYAGTSLEALSTLEKAQAEASRLGVKHDPKASHGKVIDCIFSDFVEEHLFEPTFIYDYPLALSPLAKRKSGSDDVTLRFEGFVAHMEVCNCFTELTDPDDQRGRLEEQHKAREAGDDEAHCVDEDFLLALEHGMPPAGGIGMGLERILMILLDAESIRDVILFPHMRPREEG